MSRKTTIWLILATLLILVGCILFGGVMMKSNWDFSMLSTVEYETNTYTVQENYKGISITTDTADIVFAISENAESTIVCQEEKNVKHSVAVKDGTLVIEVNDTRKWHEHIGITFRAPKITVSIPKGKYGTLSIQSSTGDVLIPKEFLFDRIAITERTGDVTNYASASEFIRIETNTGDIHVENLSAETIDLSVSTGRITVSKVTCQEDITIHVSTGKATVTDTACKNIISDGSTGGIVLKNVIAAGKLSIRRNTGDVRFDDCDAAEIFVKTSTGSVKGSLLSAKTFLTDTDTGSVSVPKGTTGGKCEITTDTGDIKIAVGQ